MPGDSPVSYTQVTDKDGHTIKGGDNDSTHEQVIPEGTAEEAKSILETVVSSGTGTHAQIGAEGQWGKTGTTENNGDAWFCGGVADEVTACVWVGYADSTTPMTTLYEGGPVMGGTFPALIWASVISAWEEIQAEPRRRKGGSKAKAATKRRRSGRRSRSEYVPAEAVERRRSTCRNPKKSKRRPNAEGGAGRRRSAGRSGAGSRAGEAAPESQRRRRRRSPPARAPAALRPAAAGARRSGCRRRRSARGARPLW